MPIFQKFPVKVPPASSGGGLSDPGANGVVVRTALNTTTARTITGTANQITVSNGNGVSGNPTIDVGANVILSSGSYSDPSWITSLSGSKVSGVNLSKALSWFLT